MPDDLLLTGGWRLWPQFALRGPGFPADGVLRLAPEGIALAADKLPDALSGPEWDEFARRFEAAAVRTAGTLQEVAARSDFRAAVGWQNRAVLGTGIAPFLSWAPTAAGRTSMPRQREELVAHYWQRFCVKNDTIGFFGPVGWGRFDPTRAGVLVDPGDRLVAESEVYLSSWAVDTLARQIAADPGLRRWLPPRRVPFARVEDGRVSLPGRPAQAVAPPLRRILELCDGTRQPAALADAVGRSVPEVLHALQTMVEQRWIVWRLDVPSGAHPDRQLRALLERVPDPAVRQRALAKLAVLEHGRERLRSAVDEPDALIAALAGLEASFVELTRAPAQREKGTRTAPCRAVAYADSRRAATVRVGTGVLDALTPLGLCLTAARWMTNRVAEAAEARIGAAYRELRDQRSTVDLSALWMRCQPTPYPGAATDAEQIQAELRRRWERIVDAPPGARRVQLSAAEIADAVRDAFDGPAHGWNLARYVSPDVFVVGDDPEAVRRGDCTLVLGELHVATNTLDQSLFVMQHPAGQELLDETDRDFPGPRVLPMLPKETPQLRWSARNRPALDRPGDYLVAVVGHSADPHRPRTVLGADVLVQERNGRLVLVLPDGAVFGLLDVFGYALTNQVINRFSLRSGADHSPRVTVDRMVVARESWRFTAEALDFATDKIEARRYVRARRWRDAHDLPRFVFVVSPAEPRPFYVDFDSPVYVNILAKAARRLHRADPAARLTVTEMLPTPEQTWLTDHRGAGYGCELRLVAVDQTTGEPT
ncbi:lantibiotic dehydratase [Micromonospora sp. NPDC048999]|uniref:lantibiotic dehydratase n=1 Tax=Micromonospora sp. NPDC048999 TaxID=3155391 RepID=UPI00340AF880